MACHAWGTWGRDLKAPTVLTENCKLYPAPVPLNRDKSTFRTQWVTRDKQFTKHLILVFLREAPIAHNPRRNESKAY